MPDFRMFGCTARLILEDANGTFEVLDAFQLEPTGVINIRNNRILAALDERSSARPVSRPVRIEFDD